MVIQTIAFQDVSAQKFCMHLSSIPELHIQPTEAVSFIYSLGRRYHLLYGSGSLACSGFINVKNLVSSIWFLVDWNLFFPSVDPAEPVLLGYTVLTIWLLYGMSVPACHYRCLSILLMIHSFVSC
jgi:hypothetical protein